MSGVAMSRVEMGWLDGKAVQMVGEAPAIAAALRARGARLVDSGPADCLVHVAPPPPVKPAHELTHAEWRATLDSGLDQRFLLARDFVEENRAAGRFGAILFVGAPEQALGSDHAAAAGGLGNLTRTLGVEWARDGHRVNAILTVESGSVESVPALGNLVAYLLSDYAAYVTGAVMGIGLSDG